MAGSSTQTGFTLSIVIPARNAGGTLAATLDSLLRQTKETWEAIIVDNGSTDNTREIAQRFAAQDSRFKIVTESQAGVCHARNTGIRSARYEWLLFLDADDYILPEYIATMGRAAASDHDVDAWYCGSMRVDRHGESVTRELVESIPDMFRLFARMSLFPIHSCVVRKIIVEQVGGFDVSLITCEDWDLWQRIVRNGGHFRSVRDYLACYRMRANSASINARQMLKDGLEVITRAHAHNSTHSLNLRLGDLSEAKLTYMCWPAGLAIGRNESALPLLELVRDDSCAELNPFDVAEALFKAVPLPHCVGSNHWPKLWQLHHCEIREFLHALELQAACPNLARRSQLVLERLIAETAHSTALELELTTSLPVEIAQSIGTLLFASHLERLVAAIHADGELIGSVELPICDGIVAAKVLKDMIAENFGWQILGKFFKRAVYWKLILNEEAEGYSVWRDGTCIARELPTNGNTTLQQLHDQIGWTVFLQELWQRPALSGAEFYNANRSETTPPQFLDAGADALRVSIEEQLPTIRTTDGEATIDLLIGGVAAARIELKAPVKEISPSNTVAQVTQVMGLELLKIAVREGLIGQEWGENSLIDLLRGASTRSIKQCNSNSLEEKLPLHFVVGTRKHGFIGSTISRHATVPSAAATEFVLAAAINKEPITISSDEHFPAMTSYNPEFLWNAFEITNAIPAEHCFESSSPEKRHEFESLFAFGDDPWRYTSDYEQLKYQQTLALLPKRGTIGRAIELGCAEGHFTEILASRVKTLIAADISQIALQRAAKRCQCQSNVSFQQLDLASCELPQGNDLIVCSEILYYLHDAEQLRSVARAISAGLNRGGYFLTAHSFVTADNGKRAAFDWNVPFGCQTISEIFAADNDLRLVRELQTKLYSIKLFRKVKGSRKLRRIVEKIKPPRIEFAEHGVLRQEVEKHVSWQGAVTGKRVDQSATTERAPILMFHRIAPVPSTWNDRRCLSPDTFEAQLRYLHECGFRSITLDEWGRAKTDRRSFHGRPVLLTFDDGFADFKTWAWPLLRKFEFTATMFVVAGHVGRTNSWEVGPDRQTELLGWEDLKQLKAEGLQIGAHSFTHRHMTGLSTTEVVIEASRSRRTLEQGLESPVLSFAYPYGDTDRVVQHLTGACGFLYGVTCNSRPASFGDSLLALPRIEITNDDTVESFVAKLASSNLR